MSRDERYGENELRDMNMQLFSYEALFSPFLFLLPFFRGAVAWKISENSVLCKKNTLTVFFIFRFNEPSLNNSQLFLISTTLLSTSDSCYVENFMKISRK